MPLTEGGKKGSIFKGNSSSFASGKTTVPPQVALMPFGTHTKILNIGTSGAT